MRVRRYRPADFEFLSAAFQDYAVELARLDPFRRARPTPGLGAAYVRSLLRRLRQRRGIFLLAEDESGTPIGFVAGAPAPLSSVQRRYLVRLTRPCTVEELYVVPRFRRRGLGRRLLEEIEHRLAKRGYDWIRLETDPRNHPATRLYRSMGYVDIDWILGRPIRGHGPRRFAATRR